MHKGKKQQRPVKSMETTVDPYSLSFNGSNQEAMDEVEKAKRRWKDIDTFVEFGKRILEGYDNNANVSNEDITTIVE